MSGEPRTYPLPPPSGGDDARFTAGLLYDVRKVLERHGYPPIVAGADLVELQLALYAFLYSGERP